MKERPKDRGASESMHSVSGNMHTDPFTASAEHKECATALFSVYAIELGTSSSTRFRGTSPKLDCNYKPILHVYQPMEEEIRLSIIYLIKRDATLSRVHASRFPLTLDPYRPYFDLRQSFAPVSDAMNPRIAAVITLCGEIVLCT
jgi:hypothetical protein